MALLQDNKAQANDDLIRLSGTIIQAGSKSFAAAAKLFDPQTRANAYLLYAWCRHCDDVIDGQELGHNLKSTSNHNPRAALDALRQQTADALNGKPMAEPVFAAFQLVMQRNEIPPHHAYELLDGFKMDVEARHYETLEDTLSYCYHVAGVVGVMMAYVMGARKPAVLDRASDLGLAFQLTNIARDVVADAQVGRIYVPESWLREAGIPRDEIADPKHRAALASVIARLLAVAEKYYKSSRVGLSDLHLRSAWAVATARNVYRRIGEKVQIRGARAWDSRVSTSKVRKLHAACRGAGIALYTHSPLHLTLLQPRDGLWTRPREATHQAGAR